MKGVNKMKFTRVKDTYLFPIYIREDGRIKIESSNRFFGKTLKQVYVVKSVITGQEFDCFKTLREAKLVFAE